MNMEIRPLRLSGAHEIVLTSKADERGYFMRIYDEAIFQKHGLTTKWVQENQSLSVKKGVIRGLHFQRPPFAETKLVRVIAGAVLDVFVDIRRDSKTYGQWEAVELTAQNQKAIYIPKGFAHGFCTLAERSVALYKVDSFYTPEAEGGLRWNDPDLRIPWPVESPMVSAKDSQWPLFREFVTPFD